MILLIFLALSIVNGDQFIPKYLNIDDVVKFGLNISAYSNTEKALKQLRNQILTISISEEKSLVYFTPQISQDLQNLVKKTTLVLDSNNDVLFPYQLNITLFEYIRNVNHRFKQYVDYLKKFDNNDLCSLTRTQSFLERNQHTADLESHLTYAFEAVLHDMRYYNSIVHRCDKNATIPDQIIALYNILASTERKIFLIETFFYKLKSKCNNEDNSDKLRLLKTVMKERIHEYLHSVKLSAAYAQRDLYRCDLREALQRKEKMTQNELDELYFELEGYQRTVIINEKYQSADETCSSSCEEFVDAAPVSYTDIKQRSPYCLGRLKNCKSAGEVQFCKLRKKRGSSRPYQWIVDGNGNKYGTVGQCQGSSVKNSTWNQYLVYHCDNCLCTCIDDVDPSPSRYAISLNEELADYQNNEVVTGIKFTLQDHTIYPQIQTGKLLPEGNIDHNSIKWKSVNRVVGTTQTKDHFYRSDFVRFGSDDREIQRIYLENVFADPGYLVIGIKFVVWDNLHPNNKGLNVRIDVLTAEYNFTSGKLSPDNLQWINSMSSIDGFKTEFGHHLNSFDGVELMLDHMDNPINFLMNIPDSQNGQWIKFQISDIKKDAGQSTVPFFDATPVVGKPSIPLGGVGIFHKGTRTTGGFLAFKIMSLDLSHHINTINHVEHEKKGIRLSLHRSYDIDNIHGPFFQYGLTK